jgi:hypothetical protein
VIHGQGRAEASYFSDQVYNPTMELRTPAILVAHQNLLKAGGGGVQVCHREYAATLGAAGFLVHEVPYEFLRTLTGRFVSRLLPKAVQTLEPAGLFERLTVAVDRTNAEIVFFEWGVFPSVSSRLKHQYPAVRQVLLSHGVEGIDVLVDQRLRRENGNENRVRLVGERMLGHELLYEAEQRRWLDAVLTVSSFEVEIERWLGMRNAVWVPRTVLEPSLTSQPIDHRVGCVSTLDHAPNFDGLIKLLDALTGKVSGDFRFRLVGQPARQGAWLARRYPFLEYLGGLIDEDLRAEASTWCCFVHPIFVYSKGYSTKLGIALGWGLPIATTDFGARGYRWDRKQVPLARSPVELAGIVLQRCAVDQFEKHKKSTEYTARLAPRLSDVGDKIREFLNSGIRGA